MTKNVSANERGIQRPPLFEIVFTVALYAAIAVGGYFLDHKIAFSLGFIPSVCIFSLGERFNVTWANSPKLYVLIRVASATFLLAGFCYGLAVGASAS